MFIHSTFDSNNLFVNVEKIFQNLIEKCFATFSGCSTT